MLVLVIRDAQMAVFRERAFSKYLRALEDAFREEGLLDSPALRMIAETDRETETGATATPLRRMVERAKGCGVDGRSDCAVLLGVWLSAGLENAPMEAWLQSLLDDNTLSGPAKMVLIEKRLGLKAAREPDTAGLVELLQRLRTRFD